MKQREIKFRVWVKPEHWDEDKNIGLMTNGLPLGGWNKWWINITKPFDENQSLDGEFIVGEHIEIMQFTGLKDKNGVEIYEGDVLKERYYPLGAPDSVEYYKIGVVMWPNGVMWKLDGLNVLDKEKASEWYSDEKERYKHPTQGYDWVDYQVWFHRSEVIGNIFENPEMIEV